MSAQTGTGAANALGGVAAGNQPLVMQIIIDRSLSKNTDWNRGTLIAQGAHAATAILAQTWDEHNTAEYVNPTNLAHMHKVVLLSPKTGTLADLSTKLKEAAAAIRLSEDEDNDSFPKHHLWIEQPEGIPTAIAIAPNRKPAALRKALDKCSLFRD